MPLRKTGLIVGKFMPPHRGHVKLIEFGARRCDRLIVCVCSHPSEPIPGSLRWQWMKELCTSQKNVQVVAVRKNLPQDSQPSRVTSKKWAAYLLKRFKKIHFIFSSEIYGNYLAEYMGAIHEPFDLSRKKIPVSSTQIRQNPFKYWSHIPENVRPYFVKKICIYGPESTGKTTLAKQLAKHYKTVWAPEFAREYIASHGDTFTYKDISRFARGQLKSEERLARRADKIMFCDTDFITTTIYSQHYFGRCPALVRKLASQKRYDLYLFTGADLPWVPDPQRDLGGRRKEFESIFKNELVRRKIPLVVIRGKNKRRLKAAVNSVNHFLKKFDRDNLF